MAVADIYYERLMSYGVKIYKYKAGFLHQKVMLVDDLLGVVGSANLDYRSMYINFEITTVCSDADFVESLSKMLESDLKNTELVTIESIRGKSLPKKILERSVNLIAPVL
jgi:cardiolipin synthase